MAIEHIISTRLIDQAHSIVSRLVREGDSVVDATIGNGHDTLFLANCVGLNGRVIGFDVQEEALRATQQRLFDAGISEHAFELHAVSHERMKTYLTDEIAAVMFNLGYLPGSDKVTITQAETTLQALDAALRSLRAGGVLTVMCYPGHDGGDSEAEAVRGWSQGMSDLGHAIDIYRREGSRSTAPFLITLQKQP
ncbi:MAG: class I SAM-dependent methyltransferase [Akkermansiaceae bacterium]